nr:major facilitator superfamily transporter [Colletotrichum truncatum]KAF6787947.1 major facilitator superfamily transporter [Colletotrichum truncatum]
MASLSSDLNGTQVTDDNKVAPMISTEAPQETSDAEKNITAVADEADEKKEYPTGIKRILIILPATLSFFLVFLDLAVVSTATPAITSSFQSLVDVGWYGGAYQLGGSAFQPLSGKIYQHFSAKWSFLVFFGIFELGSLLCGVATSSSMFIIGRAIAGVGSSGLSTGTLTIISCIMPPKEQAKFLGVSMGLGQLGIALGPVLGGLFTEYVSWRWFGVPIAVLLILSRIPDLEPKPPARQVLGTAIKSLDLPGFLLISPAAVMFLLGLQYGGNEYAWNSSVVIGLLVGGGMTFVAFLFWEHRQGDGAMVPFAMLKHRIIWSAAGCAFFLLGTVLVADFYLAIYFQAVHGDSPFMSGVHLLPTTLSLVLFTMISGVMIEKLGYYLPWVTGGSSIAAIGYGLLSTLSPTTSTAKWIGYQLFYGVGSGSMSSGHYIAVQNLVPAPQIPIAMAIVIFMQNMGGAIFLVAANAVFSNTLRKELQQRALLIGVEPDVIVNSGLNSIRRLVSGDQLRHTLQAYSDSVDTVMYLGIGIGFATFSFAWGLGWKDIRVERKLKALKSEAEDQKQIPRR